VARERVERELKIERKRRTQVKRIGEL